LIDEIAKRLPGSPKTPIFKMQLTKDDYRKYHDLYKKIILLTNKQSFVKTSNYEKGVQFINEKFRTEIRRLRREHGY